MNRAIDLIATKEAGGGKRFGPRGRRCAGGGKVLGARIPMAAMSRCSMAAMALT